MSEPSGPDADASTDGSGGPSDPADLRAEMAVLREENRRLREAYAHSRRTSYRRTALGLLLVGAAAGVGAWLFPSVRQVLVVLAAVGAFGGVLTYYLTPEGFVATSVSERVYAALSESIEGLLDELGLSESRIYVPTDGRTAARLFVPQNEGDALPEAAALDDVLVVGDNGTRGVSLRPTGDTLFREFERALAEPFADAPEVAVEQLADALVENFEIASGTAVDADPDGTPRRVTVRAFGTAYGRAERPDNPVASLLGVGLARAVGAPVSVDTGFDDDALVVTCRWRADGEGAPGAGAETGVDAGERTGAESSEESEGSEERVPAEAE